MQTGWHQTQGKDPGAGAEPWETWLLCAGAGISYPEGYLWCLGLAQFIRVGDTDTERL